LTLNKEAPFAECLPAYSTKGLTKRPTDASFYRVSGRQALDKEAPFAECQLVALYTEAIVGGPLELSLPSARPVDTRQSLRHRHSDFSLPSVRHNALYKEVAIDV
jgi:hypothetical protein